MAKTTRDDIITLVIDPARQKKLKRIAVHDPEKGKIHGDRPTMSKHARRAIDMYYDSFPKTYFNEKFR